MDLEIKKSVRGPFSFKVEPRGSRYEMQAAGQGDARIVVELDVALERRVPGEDWLNDARREALEARVESECQPSRWALPARTTRRMPRDRPPPMQNPQTRLRPPGSRETPLPTPV